MFPLIVDPIPSGRRLPLMNSIKDAAQLNIQERTTFYVSAFLFQCWISELSLADAAQIAEINDPKRRAFQHGAAWRGFRKFFGRASDAELPHIFGHLMEFASYDDPLAAIAFEAVVPLSIEHQLTGQFLGKKTPPALAHDRQRVLTLMRSTLIRLADWLDSVSHFRVLLHLHLLPDCLDPDPQKRELAWLAINQRHFDFLDEHSQAHWLNHMSDAAQEYKNSPHWAFFRRLASGPLPERHPWPTQPLDSTLIKLWPLVKRYRWSAPQLHFVLAKVLSPNDLDPCPDPAALVAYCADTLSLRCSGFNSLTRQPSEPHAFNVALRLCQPDTAEPSPP